MADGAGNGADFAATGRVETAFGAGIAAVEGIEIGAGLETDFETGLVAGVVGLETGPETDLEIDLETGLDALVGLEHETGPQAST